jgi:hypothetical protein
VSFLLLLLLLHKDFSCNCELVFVILLSSEFILYLLYSVNSL